eukprot:9260557-Pyramimonas_sp.AAC.1
MAVQTVAVSVPKSSLEDPCSAADRVSAPESLLAAARGVRGVERFPPEGDGHRDHQGTATAAPMRNNTNPYHSSSTPIAHNPYYTAPLHPSRTHTTAPVHTSRFHTIQLQYTHAAIIAHPYHSPSTPIAEYECRTRANTRSKAKRLTKTIERRNNSRVVHGPWIVSAAPTSIQGYHGIGKLNKIGE